MVSDSTCLKACANTVSVSSNNTTFQYNPDTVKLIDEYMLDLEEGSN